MRGDNGAFPPKKNWLMCSKLEAADQQQERVQGGPRGLGPPPLEIEKQKKKKKVIRANFKLFHLYFATFLVQNIIFSAIF